MFFIFIIHIYTNIFCKKLVLSSLPDYNRNTIPDYIRNTVGYCFHNNTEQKKSKKLSVLRLDLNFLLKRCVFVYVCVFVYFCLYSIKKETDYM